MRRNPTSISALWLFLLSSLARRNGLLAISLWRRRRKPVDGLGVAGRSAGRSTASRA
jgi:hypothetical protein